MHNFANGIHPSVLRQQNGFLRQVPADQRPHGAVRYGCPVTGSLVLITDDSALRRLSKGRARLRCAGCGEMHLLTCNAVTDGEAAVIVAQRAKS
jgi:hypothetical protein